MFADADICVKNKATEYLIGCEIYFLCFAWRYVDSTCRIKLSGIYKIRCRYCGGMDLSGYGMADPKYHIFTPVSFRKMVKNTLLKQ